MEPSEGKALSTEDLGGSMVRQGPGSSVCMLQNTIKQRHTKNPERERSLGVHADLLVSDMFCNDHVQDYYFK